MYSCTKLDVGMFIVKPHIILKPSHSPRDNISFSKLFSISKNNSWIWKIILKMLCYAHNYCVHNKACGCAEILHCVRTFPISFITIKIMTLMITFNRMHFKSQSAEWLNFIASCVGLLCKQKYDKLVRSYFSTNNHQTVEVTETYNSKTINVENYQTLLIPRTYP